MRVEIGFAAMRLVRTGRAFHALRRCTGWLEMTRRALVARRFPLGIGVTAGHTAHARVVAIGMKCAGATLAIAVFRLRRCGARGAAVLRRGQ